MKEKANVQLTWYAREVAGERTRQLWRFTPRTATRMYVTSPEHTPGAHHEASAGETIWECIRRRTSWFEQGEHGRQFIRLRLAPGTCYPRMARPFLLAGKPKIWLVDPSDNAAYIADAKSQLLALARQLEGICRVVQPASVTLDVYGHEIRNLLILAATEVEMHWRGIFSSNGQARDSFNTQQYSRLLEPLQLQGYSIGFYSYPGAGTVRPFGEWRSDDATQTLRWYVAYHGVKHNREKEFERATLRHAFEAIAACAILFVAQFGQAALGNELSVFFKIHEPVWPLSEMYVSPLDDGPWRAVNHPDLILRDRSPSRSSGRSRHVLDGGEAGKTGS